MNKAWAAAIGLWLLAMGTRCTFPPRTSIFPPPPEPEQTPYAVQRALDAPAPPPPRIDTIYIKAAPQPETLPHHNEPLYTAASTDPQQLEEAITLIENHQLAAGCQKLAAFLANYPMEDSLYYEAKFYEAECAIQHQDFADALQKLLRLNARPALPPTLHQKVLVRIGQLHCVLNHPQVAEQYFTQLKTLYPNSPFLRLANCDFLR